MEYNFGILTASDRCSNGQREDTSGPLLKKLIQEDVDFLVKYYDIVPDDQNILQERLQIWINRPDIHCIITTGGTGLTPTDCTPEATEKVIEKDVPGIRHALFSASLKATPLAMLSRLKCGISKETLIINFPGSKNACMECYSIIKPVLKHALDQINGNLKMVNSVHETMQQTTVEEIPASQRDRESPYKKISIKDALEKISKEVIEFNFVTKEICGEDLDQAVNHFLARNVFAKDSLPPFDASIKDGYAMISSNPSESRTVRKLPSNAGDVASLPINWSECVRISTGAPLPPDADSVVQVEDTVLEEVDENEEETRISLKHVPVAGENVRKTGCDIPADSYNPLVEKFSKLDPINLGLIASSGVDKITVFKRPVVAVLSTGDELVPPGESRPQHSIWDSNRTVLKALLKVLGFTVIDLGISIDTPQSIFTYLKRGLEQADVLISTGGVSMGERDFLKQVLEQDFKAEIHFGRVNMKPGLPTTFATTNFHNRKKFIFSLPGNPVSAFVTFKVFVEQTLHLLSGECFTANNFESPIIISASTFRGCARCRVKDLIEPYEIGSRPELVRVHVSLYHGTSYSPTATLTDQNQISSRLLSVRNANGFLYLEKENPENEEMEYLESGQTVNVICW